MKFKEKLDLNGKKALVTGAGRGIGRSCAEALCETGAFVTLSDINLITLENTVNELKAQDFDVDMAELDVTDTEGLEKFCSKDSPYDILVCNAGIVNWVDAIDMTDECWNNLLNVNLSGVFKCCRTFGRNMIENGGGSIVNIGSMSGIIVNTPQSQAHYNTSKAAVHQLTKSLAVEWAQTGVRVNSVAPTYIETDLLNQSPDVQKYIEKWKSGEKIVLGKKATSDETKIFFSLRNLYYKFLNLLSEDDLTLNTTGSGIFDKEVIEELKKIKDPYPYFRGLITELGYKISFINFNQPKRMAGQTKNNIFTLYDIAMLGLVKHSRKPLRFMVLVGFFSSFICFLTGLIYLFYKIIFWNSFSVGVAPIVIGLFLIASIQITLLGLVGEYIGVILLNQKKTPLVVEKERINFN